MHAFSLITALSAVASAAVLDRRATTYAGPSESGPFQLEVIATDGNLAVSGFFLNPYHTGAGLNVLTAGNGQAGAQKYNFSAATGEISATLGAYPYYFTLDGEVVSPYGPPKGYTLAGFNVGGTDNHFHFTTPGNYLQFGPSYADDIWSVCPAEIYSPGVYVDTLVYRTPGSTTNATCADVKVKAIF